MFKYADLGRISSFKRDQRVHEEPEREKSNAASLSAQETWKATWEKVKRTIYILLHCDATMLNVFVQTGFTKTTHQLSKRVSLVCLELQFYDHGIAYFTRVRADIYSTISMQDTDQHRLAQDAWYLILQCAIDLPQNYFKRSFRNNSFHWSNCFVETFGQVRRTDRKLPVYCSSHYFVIVPWWTVVGPQRLFCAHTSAHCDMWKKHQWITNN